MSKYGDFEVVRTERRVPKKATDPNVDADGMREYSFLKCPHCKTEDIIIASLNLKVQKHATIREHIAVCPSYMGERPTKRCKEKKESTALVLKSPVVPSVDGEPVNMSIEDQLLALKNKVEGQQQQIEGQQQEIKGLQDKATLYDGVLAAVMPSLTLPLTAPQEKAMLTLREAAMKDIAPRGMALALTSTMDVVPREMHTAMLEQKDELIAVEKERREEMRGTLEDYKRELEVKDTELSKALSEREAAVSRQREVEEEMRVKLQEANNTATTASSRADRLLKERDALKAKVDASKEQLSRPRLSFPGLSKSYQQEMKRKFVQSMEMDARTAAAQEDLRLFAEKRRREGLE